MPVLIVLIVCPYRSFIAVEKRVVLNDMEEIRRCHLKQISMEEFASERCLRHRGSGVQQADVSDTLRTPHNV